MCFNFQFTPGVIENLILITIRMLDKAFDIVWAFYFNFSSIWKVYSRVVQTSFWLS